MAVVKYTLKELRDMRDEVIITAYANIIANNNGTNVWLKESQKLEDEILRRMKSNS